MRSCHPCDPITGKRRHPSSYGMQDSQIVFNFLGLKPGDVFLDAGCGLGEYALEAARLVGERGVVHALDATPGCIEDLAIRAAALGLTWLRAGIADITGPLPLPDASVTVGLLGTVLHIPPVTRVLDSLGAEMARVLRPRGRLGVIECTRRCPMGPPLSMRLPAERVAEAMEACGFHVLGTNDMGNTYLSIFQKPSSSYGATTATDPCHAK